MATPDKDEELVAMVDRLLAVDAKAAQSIGFMYTLKQRRDALKQLIQRYTEVYKVLDDSSTLPSAVVSFWRYLSRLPPSAFDSVLRTLATLPEGIPFTIQLRHHILLAMRRKDVAREVLVELRALDQSLKASFARQVAAELRRISMSSDEKLLHFIVKKEAVHPFLSSQDLSFRLGGPGRRCYGLFHPFMPNTPLVYVQIALLDQDDPPSVLSEVLDPTVAYEPLHPRTAVFYSVTNAMPGLAGLQLASYLLFLCIEALSAEIPSITSFVTLSPAPGLRSWVRKTLAERDAWMVTDAEARELVPLAADKFVGVQELLRSSFDSPEGKARCVHPLLKSMLLRWAGRYILFERREGSRKCLDPVANFHVSNGATVHRINPSANMGPRGVAQSFGIMVNYKYDMSSAGTAARRYVKSGTLAATEAAILLQSIGFPSVFEGLTTDFMRSMHVPVCARVVPADTWLFRADDPTTLAFYILVLGKLDVFCKSMTLPDNAAGSEQHPGLQKIGEMIPGNGVGALAVLEGRDPFCYFRTSGLCYVLEMPLEVIERIAKEHPAEAKHILQNAKRQLLDALQLGAKSISLKSKL